MSKERNSSRGENVAPVWSGVPPDATLIKAFQEYFAETVMNVVAVFKVIKLSEEGAYAITPSTTFAPENVRLLVLTVKTIPNSTRLQPILNKFVMVTSKRGTFSFRMQGRAWPLKLLSAERVLLTSHRGPECAVCLVWGSQRLAPTSPVAAARAAGAAAVAAESHVKYAVPDASSMMSLLAVLYLACVAFDGHEPELQGIDSATIQEWRKTVKAKGQPCVVMTGVANLMFEEQGGKQADNNQEFKYLSAKDQQQLSSLLQMFTSSADVQVSALQESLNAEYAALEAANVHAILNSSYYIPQVLRKINVAFNKLEDLELSLEVFDGKLAVMRDDIAAIEARNNTLEVQTRNLGALQASMRELLGLLSMDRSANALAECDFKGSKLLALVDAAWQMQAHLEVLTGRRPGLKPEAQSMRAVVEFRGEMLALAKHFQENVKRFLNKRFTEMGGLSAEEGFPAQPVTMPFFPLLQVAAQLPGGPSVITSVNDTFVTVMTTHIRQCVRSRVSRVQSLKFQPISEGAEDRSNRGIDRSSGSISGRNVSTNSPNMVHNAIIQVLQDLLPLISHAVNYTCDFLMLRACDEGTTGRKPSPAQLKDLLRPHEPLSSAGRAHAANMLSGLSGDLIRLLDLVPKRTTLPLVAIAAVCQAWRQHLAAFPATERLASLMAEVIARVEGTMEAQGGLMVKEVDRYDGSRMGGMWMDKNSVQHIHVLPFVEDLTLRAANLSNLVREGVPSLQWPQPWGVKVLVAEDSSVLMHASDLILSFFNKVARAVFDALKRLSASDPKHGVRLLVENFCYMEHSMQSLAAVMPELQTWSRKLSADLESALNTYVEQQLQYSRFWGLLELGDKLAALLRDVSPAEVPFQVGFSHQAVQSSLSEPLDSTEKKIVAMGQRVRKHLGDNTTLLRRVWQAINRSMIGRLHLLEQHLEKCYPDLRLPYSADQIEEMLKIAAP